MGVNTVPNGDIALGLGHRISLIPFIHKSINTEFSWIRAYKSMMHEFVHARIADKYFNWQLVWRFCHRDGYIVHFPSISIAPNNNTVIYSVCGKTMSN